MTHKTRTGARLIVDAMRAHAIDTVFTVPGESFLGLLDALLDVGNEIRLVTCRQEGGAAFMAEAYGKATGRPAALAVTRGPGAANAAIGIHTAFQDSTPMLTLIGQVPRAYRGREAFQEVDLEAMFAPLAKWTGEVASADEIPREMSNAMEAATGGRPGPAVLAVPEDVFAEESEAADVKPLAPRQTTPDLVELVDLLTQAERPLVILGGGGWTMDAATDMRRFLEAWQLPAAVAFRRQDRLDNRSPSYAGLLGLDPDPALRARAGQADLLLAFGTRLGEIVTQQYQLPTADQVLVHAHADPKELGRVHEPTLALNANPPSLAAALAALAPPEDIKWAQWTRQAHDDYLASLEPDPAPGPVDFGAIAAKLNELIPENAFISNDAGNFAGWINRFYRFSALGTQLGPTNGAMGYAVPAAIAAKFVDPARTAVAFVGDGGALMTGQELATAAQYGLDPVVVVVNNAMYGTIRMHQEAHFPTRVSGTDLANPDFVTWARSFGAQAERVEKTADFAPALSRALSAGKPAVIELMLDQEAITSRTTLTALRQRAAK